jgi:hypothetical protein
MAMSKEHHVVRLCSSLRILCRCWSRKERKFVFCATSRKIKTEAYYQGHISILSSSQSLFQTRLREGKHEADCWM